MEMFCIDKRFINLNNSMIVKIRISQSLCTFVVHIGIYLLITFIIYEPKKYKKVIDLALLLHCTKEAVSTSEPVEDIPSSTSITYIS